MVAHDKNENVIYKSDYGMGSSSASCSTSDQRALQCRQRGTPHPSPSVGTFLLSTNPSDQMFRRAPLLLNVASKQIDSSLLHGDDVSNPPWRGERFRPWDGRPLAHFQLPQGRRRDRVLLQGGDDRASLPRLRDGDNHRAPLAMARRFHRCVATSDSSLSRANRHRQSASI